MRQEAWRDALGQRTAHRRASSQARRRLHRLGLSRIRSLDEAITTLSRQAQLPISVTSRDLGSGVFGLTIKHTDGFCVLWNNRAVLSHRHRDVIIAHELGHIAADDLGYGIAYRCHSDGTVDSNAHDEIAAEAFAAALLDLIQVNRGLAARLSDL